jgi:hypothetical protein
MVIDKNYENEVMDGVRLVQRGLTAALKKCSSRVGRFRGSHLGVRDPLL